MREAGFDAEGVRVASDCWVKVGVRARVRVRVRVTVSVASRLAHTW